MLTPSCTDVQGFIYFQSSEKNRYAGLIHVIHLKGLEVVVVNPNQQLTIIQPPTHSFPFPHPSGMGKEVKNKENSWVKSSLITEIKI